MNSKIMVSGLVVIIVVISLVFLTLQSTSDETQLPVQNNGNGVVQTPDMSGDPTTTTEDESKIPIEDLIENCPWWGIEDDFNVASAGDTEALEKLKGYACISLFQADVENISILSSLTNLQSLSLSWTDVSDISSLSSLTKLRSLSLENTKVSDISALSDLMDMEVLILSYTNVSDISPIEKMTKLKALDLKGTHISDISPLNNLKNLEELELSMGQDENYLPIKLDPNSPTVKTVEKEFFGSNITIECLDLSVLSNLKELRIIKLSDLYVCDTEPLNNLENLEKLSLEFVSSNECDDFKQNFPTEGVDLYC